MYSRWNTSPYDLELYHHGIKGQRWGVRRFQNRDGTRIERLIRLLELTVKIER